MRRAAKTDDNQRSIVDYARNIGFTVTPTHQMGRGFPDLVLGMFGLTFLAEIKDGKKKPSAQKLTGDEQEWHDDWRGHICVIKEDKDVWALREYAVALSARISGNFTMCPTMYANGYEPQRAKPPRKGKEADR